jgi:toxin ParE1/3/4
MGLTVSYSVESRAHLKRLEKYLSRRFYPANAERFVRRLVLACEDLGAAPYRGAKHDDLGPGMRSLGFERRATIYFVVQEQRVVIVGVYYGGRSFGSSDR